MRLDWFNLSLPPLRIGRVRVWLYNAFRRVQSDGTEHWGFGLLQVNGRHLFYVGLDAGLPVAAVLFTERFRRPSLAR